MNIARRAANHLMTAAQARHALVHSRKTNERADHRARFEHEVATYTEMVTDHPELAKHLSYLKQAAKDGNLAAAEGAYRGAQLAGLFA